MIMKTLINKPLCLCNKPAHLYQKMSDSLKYAVARTISKNYIIINCKSLIYKKRRNILIINLIIIIKTSQMYVFKN